jgi:hypothetical protein
MSKRTKVQIFVGDRQDRKVVWAGSLEHLPRQHEEVVYGNHSGSSGHVTRTIHFPELEIVDVYIR